MRPKLPKYSNLYEFHSTLSKFKKKLLTQSFPQLINVISMVPLRSVTLVLFLFGISHGIRMIMKCGNAATIRSLSPNQWTLRFANFVIVRRTVSHAGINFNDMSSSSLIKVIFAKGSDILANERFLQNHDILYSISHTYSFSPQSCNSMHFVFPPLFHSLICISSIVCLYLINDIYMLICSTSCIICRYTAICADTPSITACQRGVTLP